MNPILKAHVALNVSDIDRSRAFYERMLGVAPVKVRPGYAKFDVQDPPLNLTLNGGADGGGGKIRSGALSHMGLQVANTADVLALRNRWKQAGLEPKDEMQTSCCYALQDKTWVSDPDGNNWEAFTVLADIEPAEGTVCCGTNCSTEESLTQIAL